VPEDEAPVLDEGVLGEVLESTGNDIGFVRELVDTYLADTPVQLEAMTAAVGADDANALVRPAHTLKSSSASVGAMRLAAVARELEMAGRTGTLEPSVPAVLEAARREWQAASEAFAAWLDRAAAE
jgi:HPt (histidine-containing phosphotransfer) domain-containing protein